MYHRLGSTAVAAVVARHFKKNKSTIMTITKRGKEICGAFTAATAADTKALCFLENIFLSCVENASFMWMKDCHEKGIPIEFNMI